MTGWNRAKVDAFSSAFYEFLDVAPIDSKDLGGGTILGRHIFRAQKMFLDAVWDALADDIHSVYVLKSRQLGVSTVARSLSLFWAGMHEGLRGAVVFDSAFNAQQARKEMLAMVRGLPRRFSFPRIREDNRDNLILENGSSLLFLSAGKTQGRSGGSLGRSVGLNFGHISEISSFVNEEGLTSFEQSLSEVFENRLYIWESTARGYNVWHDLYNDAKEDDLGKRTVFLGWWSKDSQELKEGTPEYERYAEAPPTKRERERMKAVLDQYGWEITRGQLAWYRKLTDPAQEGDDDIDQVLQQEQPWDESESWQQTGSFFFQPESLTRAANLISGQPQAQRYHFWPGNDFTSCEIKPERSRKGTDLWVWEEPVAHASYVISGDPAFGRDERNNHSAAQVLRCYADGVDQVAEFASPLCPPHQFAWLLLALVAWYGGSKPGSRVLMICELNGPGEEVWRQYQATLLIVQRGYLRKQAEERGIADIYANARSYMYQRSDSMVSGNSLMFKTNGQLKVQIMEACRNYMQSGTILVRSLPMLEEMRSISRDGDTIGAEGRNRDDRTFALAMGIRAWEEKIRRNQVINNQTRQAERARLSMSITDQRRLFDDYMLSSFFERKTAQRVQMQRAMQTQRNRIAARRRY